MAEPIPREIHVRIGRVCVHGAEPPSQEALAASLHEAVAAHISQHFPAAQGDAVASQVAVHIAEATGRPAPGGGTRRASAETRR